MRDSGQRAGGYPASARGAGWVPGALALGLGVLVLFGLVSSNLLPNLWGIVAETRSEAGAIARADATLRFMALYIMLVLLVVVVPIVAGLLWIGLRERLQERLAGSFAGPVARTPPSSGRGMETHGRPARAEGEAAPSETGSAAPSPWPGRPALHVTRDDVQAWVREEVGRVPAGQGGAGSRGPERSVPLNLAPQVAERYQEMLASLEAPFRRERDRGCGLMAPFWYYYPQALYRVLAEGQLKGPNRLPGEDVFASTIGLLGGVRDLLYDWAYEINLQQLGSDLDSETIWQVEPELVRAILQAMESPVESTAFVSFQEARLRRIAAELRSNLDGASVLRRTSLDFVLGLRPEDDAPDPAKAAWVLLAFALQGYVASHFSRLFEGPGPGSVPTPGEGTSSGQRGWSP